MDTLSRDRLALGTASIPLWAWLCLAPGLWALVARPPLPLDELRYLSVAWEMWQGQHVLVPWLNGAPYSDKPPLLFWLIQGGWWLFGVNEWWPRLIGPLAATASAALTASLARRLWPVLPAPAATAPLLLAGSLAWIVFGQMLMFDTLLTAFVLLGISALWTLSQAERAGPRALLILAMAAGILTKGPIALVHVLVPGMLGPWWAPGLRQRWGRWTLLLLASGLAALLVAGLWALPAAMAGGPAYGEAILWHQTAGRMGQSFAHARPWYAYLVFLPLMLLPWVLVPWNWRARPLPSDRGTRLVLAWGPGVVLALSLLSAKQPHYALPALPAFALLLARQMSRHGAHHRVGGDGIPARLRWTAVATVTVVLLAASAYFRWWGAGLDLREVAGLVAERQTAGVPVAVLGRYHGQLTFLGHLLTPPTILEPAGVEPWISSHPTGLLLTFRQQPPLPLVPLAKFPYRNGELVLWQVAPAGETAS